MDMVERERTYITSIEKTIQVMNSDDTLHSEGSDSHSMNDLNSMFFVVKNYTNMHQPLDLLNKYLYIMV